MPAWLFWGGMGVIAVGGTLLALRHKAEIPVHEQEAHDIDEALPGHFHLPEAEVDPSSVDMAPKDPRFSTPSSEDPKPPDSGADGKEA